MKLFLLACFLWICGAGVYAQGSISGKTLDANNAPIEGMVVRLVGTTREFETNTDPNGEFSFKNIGTGSYNIIISDPEYFEFSEEIDYVNGEEISLTNINLDRVNKTKDPTIEVPTSTMVEDDNDDAASNSSVVSLLNSSRNSFVNAASFSLSQGGFQMRGLNRYDDLLYINGIPMQNLFFNGTVSYGDFSGLNDVLRSRNTYYGLESIPFAFGQLGTTIDVDAESINQRQGLRVSGMLTNRNFKGRAMVTYGTGLLKNGLSFTVSGSFRGAKEGYIPGTPYESFSGFASVSKVWNSKANTTLTAFASKTNKAIQGTATQEAMNLAGSNYYNPSWGWYHGEQRSSNLHKDFIPNIILSNEFLMGKNTKLNLSLGYQFGTHKSTKVDWYQAANPNPTYYKYLPSYYNDNPALQQQLTDSIVANPNYLQMNWEGMVEANTHNTQTSPDGTTTGNWARYILYNDVQKLNNLTFNATVEHQLADNITLNAGVMAQNALNQHYKEIQDLLGADYYVNVNQYAERADLTNPVASQNNVRSPNQTLRVSDVYGFDYLSRITKLSAFAQTTFRFERVDLYVAFNLSNSSMQRNGYMQNGAYLNSSYGNSATPNFTNYGIKAGATFKVDGRNYFTADFVHMTNAPEFNQVFPIYRTSNLVDSSIRSAEINSIELGYVYKGPKIKLHTNFFYTDILHESSSTTFYTELTNSLGNYVLTNMDKRLYGLELSIDAQLKYGFSATFAGSMGDYTYNNRPKATFYYDNVNKTDGPDVVYFDRLHLATGPQNAGMVRLNYTSKQFWTVSTGVNYFDKNYVNPNPQRRTQEAVDNVPYGSAAYYYIVKQEMLPSAFTWDASFRMSVLLNKYVKTFKKRKAYIDLNLSVNNILNYTNYIRTGSEQLRFDFTENNPAKFPNRYSYMLGRTYAINLVFRM